MNTTQNMSNGFNLSAGSFRLEGIDTLAEGVFALVAMVVISILLKTVEQMRNHTVNKEKKEYGERKLESTRNLSAQLERVASMQSPGGSSSSQNGVQ